LIVELAGRQHGMVARRQLLGLGIKRGAIDARIERGILRPVHRGVYAFGHGSSRQDGRLMAAVLACGKGAVLSRRSAGQLWGIVPRRDHWPEVTCSTSAGTRRRITVHRGSLAADEVGEVRGIPVTSVPRTIFDLAGMSSMRELERAFHEAEVRELRDALSLSHLLARYPRRRGARNLRTLLGAKTPAGITQTDLEELFVEFLDEYGLPRPIGSGTGFCWLKAGGRRGSPGGSCAGNGRRSPPICGSCWRGRAANGPDPLGWCGSFTRPLTLGLWIGSSSSTT
jgi:hypothetical protein